VLMMSPSISPRWTPALLSARSAALVQQWRVLYKTRVQHIRRGIENVFQPVQSQVSCQNSIRARENLLEDRA